MNAPAQQGVENNAPSPTRPKRKLPKADLMERVVWAVIVLGCLTVLGLSAWLEPSTAGHGTHEQLGLPACGMVTAYNMPCPSCGFTTTFAHAAHFRFIEAIKNQPFGFLLFMGAVAAIPIGIRVVFYRYSVLVKTFRWPWKTIIALTIAGWLLGWAYKWSMWPVS
jgi:hypothetical protein